MRVVFEDFEGDDKGENPFFNDEPRDNLSPFDFSDDPDKAERKPLIAELLLIEERLPHLAAATALSKTNLR